MGYLIRLSPAAKGENPEPKPDRVDVWSDIAEGYVLERVSAEEALEFLSVKAAERELGARKKELAKVQRQKATNPLVPLT